MSRTITVEIDSEMHSGSEPASEVQRIVWETLDTAWKLLREGSVRLVLAQIREAHPSLPDDEQMFREARESGDPEAPTSYLDLAPDRGDGPNVELAGKAFHGAFQMLASQVMAEALDGLGLDEGVLDARDDS